MTRIAFTVQGRPVAKGRPRFGRGRAYTPGITRAWEEAVGWAYKESGGPLFRGPVEVGLVFRAYAWPGDLDNLQKALLDGLNGLAWADDRQVRVLEARLIIDVRDEGVDVTIKEAT